MRAAETRLRALRGHVPERRRDCSLGAAGTFCLAFAASLSVFTGHPPRAEDGTSAGLRNPFYFVVDTIKTKRSGSGMSLRRQMAVTRREPWPSLLAPDHSLPLPLGSQPPLPFPPSLNEVMGLLRGDRLRCAPKSCPCLGSARTWGMKYLYGDRPRISDQMSAPSRITSQ